MLKLRVDNHAEQLVSVWYNINKFKEQVKFNDIKVLQAKVKYLEKFVTFAFMMIIILSVVVLLIIVKK